MPASFQFNSPRIHSRSCASFGIPQMLPNTYYFIQLNKAVLQVLCISKTRFSKYLTLHCALCDKIPFFNEVSQPWRNHTNCILRFHKLHNDSIVTFSFKSLKVILSRAKSWKSSIASFEMGLSLSWPHLLLFILTALLSLRFLAPHRRLWDVLN